jgi:hypothetical protein
MDGPGPRLVVVADAAPPAARRAHVLLASVVAGAIAPAHLRSVLASLDCLRAAGADVSTAVLDAPDAATARNAALATFLARPEASHLLLADASAAWPADAPLHLLAAGRDFVGVPLPSVADGVQWARLDAAVGAALRKSAAPHNAGVAVPDLVRHAMLRYEVARDDRCAPDVVDGVAEVAAVGAGLLLLSRAAAAALRHAEPDAWCAPPPSVAAQLPGDAAAAFAALFRPRVADGELVADDAALCAAYRRGGGRVFAHILLAGSRAAPGQLLEGRYVSSVNVGAPEPAAPPAQPTAAAEPERRADEAPVAEAPVADAPKTKKRTSRAKK